MSTSHEARAADKAARKEARARKRTERESADEHSVWQQVDDLFAIVQAEARREPSCAVCSFFRKSKPFTLTMPIWRCNTSRAAGTRR